MVDRRHPPPHQLTSGQERMSCLEVIIYYKKEHTHKGAEVTPYTHPLEERWDTKRERRRKGESVNGRGRGELVFLLSGSKLVSDGLLMKQGQPLVTVLAPILTLMIRAHPNCRASLLLQADSQTDRQSKYRRDAQVLHIVSFQIGLRFAIWRVKLTAHVKGECYKVIHWDKKRKSFGCGSSKVY